MTTIQSGRMKPGVARINGREFNVLVSTIESDAPLMLASFEVMLQIGRTACHFMYDVRSSTFLRIDNDCMEEANQLLPLEYWPVSFLLNPDEYSVLKGEQNV